MFVLLSSFVAAPESVFRSETTDVRIVAEDVGVLVLISECPPR